MRGMRDCKILNIVNFAPKRIMNVDFYAELRKSMYFLLIIYSLYALYIYRLIHR